MVPLEAQRAYAEQGWAPLTELPGLSVRALAAAAADVVSEAHSETLRPRLAPGRAPLRFPVTLPPAAVRLALHEGLLAAAALLLGVEGAMDLRLVAAALHPPGTASREPLLGAAGLMPGSEAVEFVLDLADVAAGSMALRLGAALQGGAQAGLGLVMRVGYRRGADGWVHVDSFTGSVAGNTALIESLTPAQRCVLGFPRPGHPRLTASVLQHLASRYPGLDTTPYEAQLKAPRGDEGPEGAAAGRAPPAKPVDFMSESERL